MVIINVQIKGLSPILLNNPASMAGNGAGKKVIPTPEQEAAAKCYWDAAHKSLALPSWNLHRAIISASRGYKDGKKSFAPVVNAGVRVEPADILLFGTDKYTIDIRRAVVQRQGILRARPSIFPWALSFDLLVNEEDVSPRNMQMLRPVVEDAGRRIGLGDFRLEKSGPFGKFEIAAWEVRA